VELGIISLSDLQIDPTTHARHDAGRRLHEIVSYAVAADQPGVNVFGLGEHHCLDFAIANPAVPLAAIAQATSRIRRQDRRQREATWGIPGQWSDQTARESSTRTRQGPVRCPAN
jgi:hypothetical protein